MNKARVYSIFILLLLFLPIITFAQAPSIPTPSPKDIKPTVTYDSEIQKMFGDVMIKQEAAQEKAKMHSLIYSIVIAILLILTVIIGIKIYSRFFNLKKIIKYNFWILLVSLIISTPLGFNNMGIIWFFLGFPSMFLITLGFNIFFVMKNKELSLKHKIILAILMPVLVTALNFGIHFVVAQIVYYLSDGNVWYMGTRF